MPAVLCLLSVYVEIERLADIIFCMEHRYNIISNIHNEQVLIIRLII